MKKASQILLLVGAIVSFVLAGVYFVYAVLFIVAGAVGGDYIPQLLAKLGIDLTEYGFTGEDVAKAALAIGIVAGVFFILYAAFAVANGAIALIGKKKQTKTLYILNAIFGTLSGTIVNGVGGVMGMFTLPKEQKEE